MIQPKLILVALLTLFSVVAVSCGNGTPKKLGAGGIKKKPGPQDSTDPNCITPTPSNFHEITIKSSGPLPKKIAVVLEGGRKIDECKTIPYNLPPVTIATRSTQFNAITIHVQHDRFYAELPKEAFIDIFDQGDCSSPELSYLALSTPLEFKTEHPDKENCPGIQVARKTFQR